MRSLIGIALACAIAGVSTSALADEGYVTGDMNLRAGPDISYPVVDLIPAGEPVSVQGCTDGYEWCDVIWGDERGWVAGNFIEYDYNNQPVLLSGYGAAIGIPIVSFVIADYWGRYYHNRPFWGQRERWFNRPYVHHAPPRAFAGPLHDYAREGVHGGHAGYAGHSAYHGAPAQYHNNAPQYHNNAPQYHGNAPAQYHNNGPAQYHNNNPVNHGQTNHGPANYAPGNHANQAHENNHGQAPAAHKEGQGKDHHDDNKH